MTKYTVHVFGKPDCPKCEALNRNLDFLLSFGDEFRDFEKEYHNLMNEKDLAKFCLLGQLNPTKMPVFVIGDDDGNVYEDVADYELPEWRIFSRYGCQTDWSKSGMNGNISFEQVIGELRRFKDAKI